MGINPPKGVKVFLSYAHDDDQFVKRLYEDLTERHFDVWWDREKMPSRALSFLKEIQLAIDACDRLILVVSPKAASSDYVIAEWRYALETGTVINPVLRLGDYNLLAEELKLLDAPDFREDSNYATRLKTLVRQLSQPVAPMGTLVNVPTLPPHYLHRPKDLSSLMDSVLADLRRPVVVTGTTKLTAIEGMGGIGKSVLATALARDHATRRSFPDGVIWLTLGQTPNLTERQSQIAESLGDPSPTITDVQQGRAMLSRLFQDKACLLILDDVWQTKHVEAFDVLGGSCRLVVTTRDARITTGLGAVEHRVDTLLPEQSLQLLAQWSGCAVEVLPRLAHAIAQECGNLPLALAMVGARLRRDPDSWNTMLHRLREADLDRIQQQFLHYPYPDLLRAIQVSVEALESENLRERYLDFAIFPEDTPIPESVLQTLWAPMGLDKHDVKDIVTRFADLSLLRRDGLGRVGLHDLQFDFVRKQVGKDAAGLHSRLLKEYQKKCADGWSTGPNDGYFFQNLPRHLTKAGRIDELRHLLFSYAWIESKLDATGTGSLLKDYELVREDNELELIRSALCLASYSPRNHLKSQLYGRLANIDSCNIRTMLREMVELPSEPWLRLKTSTLTRPGGPLITILQGHDSKVTSIAVTPDGSRAVSGSRDGTVKVWNLRSAQQLACFREHSGEVWAVAVIPNSRQVISGAKDLCIWNIENGNLIRRLSRNKSTVTSILITPDGKSAISGSGHEDGTLTLWDTRSGDEIRTFHGHRAAVFALALTPDGNRVVSGSHDTSLKVWEIASGKEILSITEHKGYVSSVVITPDGKYAVTGSSEGGARIWDIQRWHLVRTIKMGYINTLALLPDGEHVLISESSGLKIFELETGREVYRFPYVAKSSGALAAIPHSESVIAGYDDGTLRVFDLSKSTGGPQSSSRESLVSAVVATPKHVLTGSMNGTIKVWDIKDGRHLETIDVGRSEVKSLAVTADGMHTILASYNQAIVLELETWRQVRTIDHTHLVEAVTVTPDGTYGISAESSAYPNEGWLTVWKLRSGRQVRRLGGDALWANDITVSHDGQYVITAENSRLRVWELATGREKCTMWHETNREVTSVIVTPCGKYCISASDDATLRLWEIETGEQVLIYNGHTSKVTSLDITPTGEYLISGSEDRTLKVWNLSSGRIVAEFSGEQAIRACVVASDGTTFVAGDARGTVHFLELVSYET